MKCIILENEELFYHMQIVAWISDIMVPVLFFYILGYGLCKRIKVYESFLKGAKEWLKVVVEILPTLIGLLVAVGILRASGFMEFLGTLITPITHKLGIPQEIVTLLFFKLFSGSAATGFVLDIFRTYGPDSCEGIMASILVSCTETCFYTMSVYFMAVNVTKTRYTLPGALTAIGAGVVATVVIARVMFGI